MWIEIIFCNRFAITIRVTPYAGVWIEISVGIFERFKVSVTPYAGVWIEIIHL